MSLNLTLFFQKLSKKSLYTQRTYKSILQTYFNFTSGQQLLSSQNVNKFLAFLESQGYSQSYISVAYNMLKLFFKVYEYPFKDIDDIPRVDIYRQGHPTLSNDEIQQIIKVIQERGNNQQQAFLSIATIFGLRNSELCSITQDNIAKDKNSNMRIYVATKKGGFPRWHLVPIKIKKYINKYDFKKGVSITDGHIIFKHILSYLINGKESKSRYKGWGWHAIRRSLIKELYTQGFSEYELNIFFRYGTAKSSMINRYSRLDGNDPQLFDIDIKIFNKHPYLQWWG